ncbi:alpha-1,2-fucosyltransferase [Photobacterium indicum]|uniref:Alpha-1,2-fucosyltransferase n=1 Tax=Photobacterium indicum TaxID=81447 RepID=A0A2T3L7W4_9GAMM|nr:alpha-1,2-fucosyltransferase [Photobacterium indicum]PSV46784.1 hypothetical protein C9J47_13410 [Photobacterium indicum]
MIYVKLIGGLGNQLFQIAYAYDLSKKTGKKIIIDSSQYSSYKVRELELDKLEISKIVSFDKTGQLSKFNRHAKFYRIYQKIVKTVFRSSNFGKSYFYQALKIGCLFNFDPHYYKAPSDIKSKSELFLYGYFQSEKYFIDSKAEIKSILKVTNKPNLKEQYYLDLINANKNIAISLRLGGDYFSCPILNVCDNTYYIKALRMLVSEINVRNVFVFSDDIDKARTLLSKEDNINFVYIENMDAVQSLRLMYSCDNFVIPNSSFSWWGAFLSDNPNKIILSPSRWYNYHCDVNDIFTSEMRLLDE